MINVLIKAFGFIFIIILGYVLKRKGFFNAKDYNLISKIVLNITLPASVITSFSTLDKMNSSFLFITALGLLCNCIMLFSGCLLTFKKDKPAKALYMCNLPGYNIGCFTMPYIQGFLGYFGTIVTCFFDIGNSIMCTGATYSIASTIINNDKNSMGIKQIIKKLFSSVCFNTYIIVLILSLTGIKIPQSVAEVTSLIGSANGFLAMLMVGLMFEIKIEKKYFKDITFILLGRYLGAAVFSFLFYFVLPLPLNIRQVISILVFAPITALGGVFTEKCGGNPAVSTMASSISIILSITIITILISLMNIGV